MIRTPVEYCHDGKVKFDKKGAQTAANRRYVEDHVLLRVYQCPGTSHWHLTSSEAYKKPKKR